MARLPMIQPDELPAEQHGLLSSGINLHKVMAHSPEAVRHFRALTTYVRDGSAIDPRLRELALIQIGYTAGNAYEYTHHIKVGFKNGVTPDDVRAVAAEAAGRGSALDPTAKAVLRAADGLTRRTGIPPDAFATLQQALGARALVDLVVSIVAYIATVGFLQAFEVDLEPEYHPYLNDYPLPAA